MQTAQIADTGQDFHTAWRFVKARSRLPATVAPKKQ